ncbi:DUF4214 domain-containing protein [Skermanella pratensis]|uniref:DUF4214 domain-containing protein n=1 Tax=Skermanella pratensis TaxID=2233999 RepID=UPI0013016433|nr:DUF4214 domain-containing protein [Skermanella pratensis]
MATLDETKTSINTCYETILQRIHSDIEVNSWTTPVNSGALTLDRVRESFNNSLEAQNVNSVIRLYQAAFGRVPDVNSGLSMERIADGFVNSREFMDRYGSKDVTQAFVTSAYFQVLGRVPDAGGLAHWTTSGLNAAKRSEDCSGNLFEYGPQPQSQPVGQTFTLTDGAFPRADLQGGYADTAFDIRAAKLTPAWMIPASPASMSTAGVGEWR